MPTQIDEKTLSQMSTLAALPVESSQEQQTLAALNEVLNLVAMLESVDVDGVLPLAHPLERYQQLSADAVTEHVDREALSRNAPDFEAGLYFVPKVIE